MELGEPEALRAALHAIGERAAAGVRTWQRLVEFVGARAGAEEEYCRSLARCQGVWGAPRRRAFFGRDSGATGACLASAGQVGTLRDSLAAVVDIESERLRLLATDRGAALRALCDEAAGSIGAVESGVRALRERSGTLLVELEELVAELADSRAVYERRAAERHVVEAQLVLGMGGGGEGGARSAEQEKLSQRMAVAEVALSGAETPYRQLTSIVNELLTTLHTAEVPELLEEFEALERRRMASMGSMLRAYVRLYRSTAAESAVAQWCMEEAVNSHRTFQELGKFCADS